MELRGVDWAKLGGIPCGGLQVCKDESTKSGRDINGEM